MHMHKHRLERTAQVNVHRVFWVIQAQHREGRRDHRRSVYVGPLSEGVELKKTRKLEY